MILLTPLLALLAQVTADPAPPVDVEGFPAGDTEVLETEEDIARRMTLPVTIAGQGPFEFFVDTGSQATVLSTELGKQLNLPSDGNATLVSVARRKTVELVQLDGLQLGSRIIDGLSAPLLRKHDLGADGIIGIDSLQDLRVLLNFRDNTMAVVDSGQARRNSGYEIVVRAQTKLGRMIVTNAEIDGVDTTVIIDTGAQASIGNRALQNRLRSRANTTVSGKDVLGTQFDAKLDARSNLRIGRIKMQRIPIAFTDALIFNELGLGDRPALLLGMADLRGFDRVAIDFAERKVLFDLPPRYRRGSGTRINGTAGRV